jgi:predicted DNA-binding protein (UPF0251 family)
VFLIMSPRPKRRRKLTQPPPVSGFVPEGGDFSAASEDAVILHFEEYEALKLADYDHLSQLEASKRMHVSRSTFTRIYDSARKKVAKAFVENKRISVEGGDVEFESNWYRCAGCGTVFKTGTESEPESCPVCGDPRVVPLQEAANDFSFHGRRGRGAGRFHGGRGTEGLCICPKCGYKVKHSAGVPCGSVLCPHCNIRLIREDSDHYQFILNKLNKRKEK